MKKFITTLIISLMAVIASLYAEDYALDFDGSSQYVDCGNGNLAITGANPRTVEAWVYCRTFNDAGVFQMGVPGVNLGEFTLRNTYTENVWVVQIWTSDFAVTIPRSKNNWVHFAMTYDGSTIKLYANCELVASAARTLNTQANNFYIGRWDKTYFDGMIDEVIVYNYARSEAQIRKDWIGESEDNGSGCYAYYKMNNGSGNSLSNDTYYYDFENIATVVGGSAWVTGVYETLPTGSGTEGVPYQIATPRDLYWLSQNSTQWDKYYIQTTDIEASVTSAWGSGYNCGWDCIGNSNTAFTGNYNGNSHIINNLYSIHNDADYSNSGICVGFFGNTNNATISNLGIINIYIEGYKRVGGIAGQIYTSTLSNCYTTGTVKTNGYQSAVSGGLVGYSFSNSSITNCYSSCTVSSKYYHAGGLVGINNNTNITNCHSTGDVTEGTAFNQYIGGLIGENNGSSNVSQCYSTGNVTNNSNFVGGLIGKNSATVSKCYSTGNVNSYAGLGIGGLIGDNSGTVSNSYATGSIDGDSQTGGLIGINNGPVSNTYATGSIDGEAQTGGLIGINNGPVSYSYSTGAVNNDYMAGGLIGLNGSSVSHCFWDKESSGYTSSAGGIGKSTAEMQTRSTFTANAWDFKDAGENDIWNMGNTRNSGYPYLDWQYPLDPVVGIPTVTTADINITSLTEASSGGNITDDDGGNIVERGICWNTSESPTINDLYTSDGTGAGSFTSNLIDLTPSTTYYVKAYAKNLAGIAYGDQKEFTSWDALPEFSTSLSSHGFGTLLIGEADQQTITVTNTGGGQLYITAVTDPGDAYTVSPTSADITGGNNQVFTLTFTPVTSGAHNGNLAFTDNAGNHTVAITGAGRFEAQADAGHVFTFNGNNQYLEADIVSTQTDNISMEAWVYWEGQSETNATIVYNGTAAKDGYGIILWKNAPTSMSLTILIGSVNFVFSSTTLPTNSWHHVAAVRQSGTWSLYLDGNSLDIANSWEEPNTPTGRCSIGSYDSGNYLFKGKIDEVRFWNVARSQSDIQLSCKSFVGSESGLIAYWRMDEDSGNTTGDGSGHNKTAILINSPSLVMSTVPLGSSCLYLNTTIPTGIGCTGQCCNVTITSTPNASNFLDLYTSSSGAEPISTADIGDWPEGILKRADIMWGIHKIGDVTADLVFDYSQIEGFSNPDNIRLIKRSDAGSAWTDITSDFIHNTSARTFSKTGNSSFSEFSIASTDSDTPLPIELSEFTALYQNGGVNLTWQTESETDNRAYRIYRDTTMIAELDGAGTSTEPKSYSYRDKHVIPGKTYSYVLSDVSMGNKEVLYTDQAITVTIDGGNLGEGFNIGNAYPNPFNPMCVLPLNIARDTEVQIVLYDLKGRKIRNLFSGIMQAGGYDLKIDGRTLATGIYLVVTRANEKIQLQKIVLIK